MKPIHLFLIFALVISCGGVGTKPSHDFAVDETRKFEFTHDKLDYSGNIRWDGEHFDIAAIGTGYKDGIFVVINIYGIDNDTMIQISGPGSSSYVEQHIDFSRTEMMHKMVNNPV